VTGLAGAAEMQTFSKSDKLFQGAGIHSVAENAL
jgi:hypothetical protein